MKGGKIRLVRLLLGGDASEMSPVGYVKIESNVEQRVMCIKSAR